MGISADVFVQNQSNMGRRRANAVHLIDSPARSGHSVEMARIFRKAQETILFQDSAKSKLKNLRQLLPTTPRKAHRVVGYCAKSLSNVDTTTGQPYHLPLTPVGRLSEEISPELQEPSTPADDETEAHHLSKDDVFQGTIVARRSPQRPKFRAFPAPPSPLRTNMTELGSWTDDDKYFSASPAKRLPKSPVDAWLEGVYDNLDPLASSEKDLANRLAEDEAECRSNSLLSNYANKIPSLAEIFAASGVRRKPVPTKQNTPSAPMPKCSTPRSPRYKLPQILRKFGGDSTSESPASYFSPASTLHPAEIVLYETTSEANVDHLEIARTRSLHEDAETAPLTPEVEKHRKGMGPKKQRCASYYDRDIIGTEYSA